MTRPMFGTLVGGALAVVWAAFGFWVFMGTAFAMLLGYLAARVVAGDLDLARVADALRGRRSSS
ncbi:hypothetical protein [Leifsonia aquatica]|uniref:hypothetical protein n=1 Tax=Leifsonia aquatica TaxID=144185 RepID=UPI00046A5257|nr:hypothetical protein [Leifsonia aquatica]